MGTENFLIIMLNITNLSIEKIRSGEFQNGLPELYELKNIFENNLWHHETTFEHTLLVLDKYEQIITSNKVAFLDVKVDNNSKKDLLRVAILMHDIAKKDTLLIAPDKTTSFPSHEEKGALETKNILQRFNLTENEISFIISIIKNHGKPHEILRDRENCDQHLNYLKIKISDIYNETMILAMADTMGSELKKNDEENYNFRISKYKNVLKLI